MFSVCILSVGCELLGVTVGWGGCPGYKEIEALFNTEIYFTDPYCAWQKGTVENINRQLRRYYPKATDLSTIDTEELITNVQKINRQPKKVLQWRRPIDEYERLLAA